MIIEKKMRKQADPLLTKKEKKFLDLSPLSSSVPLGSH